MSKILVGTAGWADASLVKSGLFYPPEAKSPEERLRYYASQFPVVEVDSSYYALPSAVNAQKWAERTPADFVFNIKAFRLLTGHQTPQASLPKDIQGELALHFVDRKHLYYKDTPLEIREEMWRRYELGIRPLREAGKLRMVHFQFPHWVRPGEATMAHIETCVQRLAGYQLAVEFRSSSWFDGFREQETLDWLMSLGVVHVIVDEPQNIPAKSAPQVWATTRSDLAIVRLHGRNEEKWGSKDAGSAYNRFDYDYSVEELDGLARDIEDIASAAGEVHVIFNNNINDHGVRNGRMMKQRLAEFSPVSAIQEQIE